MHGLKMTTENEKHPGGRPSLYEEKYCEEIVEFFTREPFTPILIENDEGETVVATNKNGQPMLKPCPLPTLEGFAIKIGVHRETLNNWAVKNPKFFDAIKKAKDRQKEILVQNGLVGAYEKVFAIFVAKNVTDMSDKQELDINEKHTLVPFSEIVAGVDEDDE